ncbi:MAG: hypothetical protein ACLVO2_11675 [Clostridia bacterium]
MHKKEKRCLRLGILGCGMMCQAGAPGRKAWYCDGTSRYKLTDNVQPYIFSSPHSRRPEGNPKGNRENYYLLGHSSRYARSDCRSTP